MESQRNRLAYSSIALLLLFMVVITGLAPLVRGQNPADQNQGTQAGPPASGTSNPAQAATTASPRSADVRPDSYIIGAEDMLSINVWREPEMSKVVPVRPDGMISLPLIGDVKAAGFTPLQLQEQITTAMKKLISEPQVTVIVTEVHSLSFNVVGQVVRPGFFPLTRRLTVLDSIALAGGFKDFAKTKKIYVLRTGPNGTQQRLPFNYKDVIKGKNPQENIELQPNDTVVVP